MSAGFNPSQFAAPPVGKVDPDADWMRMAEKLPASAGHSDKKRVLYIPAIPRTFLRSVAAAGDALELLLVALAEMRMRGLREIAIGPLLWAQVGSPSKRVRTRLLRQITALPAAVCRLVPRTGRPHLLITGPDWPQSLRK